MGPFGGFAPKDGPQGFAFYTTISHNMPQIWRHISNNSPRTSKYYRAQSLANFKIEGHFTSKWSEKCSEGTYLQVPFWAVWGVEITAELGRKTNYGLFFDFYFKTGLTFIWDENEDFFRFLFQLRIWFLFRLILILDVVWICLDWKWAPTYVRAAPLHKVPHS